MLSVARHAFFILIIFSETTDYQALVKGSPIYKNEGGMNPLKPYKDETVKIFLKNLYNMNICPL